MSFPAAEPVEAAEALVAEPDEAVVAEPVEATLFLTSVRFFARSLSLSKRPAIKAPFFFLDQPLICFSRCDFKRRRKFKFFSVIFVYGYYNTGFEFLQMRHDFFHMGHMASSLPLAARFR